MPRPPRFTHQDLIHAAVRVCLQDGPGALTIDAVARAAGAPTGSIYHRFASREELLAATWVATMAEFQPGFIAALTETAALSETSEPPALAGALYPVQWARDHPEAARLLVLYRRQDFVRAELPARQQETAAQLAVDLGNAISACATRAFGNDGLAAKQRTTFLVLDLPIAAMRRYLAAGILPPQDVDDLVAEAVRALSTSLAASD
jgi:AcrR family transcriptional regulator